ncbi:hypothetical protein M378DRAFT_174039 [Amanita muscaria Koide BX008]|uniref:Protein kinase domain-containing protein n=1 Tax=Amanita muscaria (strain Koide BX008) TaxID=946122 RepID=A0A0C2W0Z5_AMAMK|nr:hypothetical protein M378DRAFT_174039 [Amanita muscaria Koide BX008]
MLLSKDSSDFGISLRAGAQENDFTLYRWRLLEPIPSSVTTSRIMLRLAKAIEYLHSIGVVLHHQFASHHVFLGSDLCPRICCSCSISRSLNKECKELFSPDDNIFSFGCLFYELYSGIDTRPNHSISSRRHVVTERPSVQEIPEYAWQLIQRCCAEDPKSRPSIDEVVKEMEEWHSFSRQGWASLRALYSVLSDLGRNWRQ